MDARTFLGMEPDGDDLHWRMPVTPQLTTPGNFLFGGCGLGAALVALEAASGRPTVWADRAIPLLCPDRREVQWEVTLAAVGGHVTQGRAVGRVDGREILTVNAALGDRTISTWGACGSSRPIVPPPEDCPPRFLPELFRNTIMDSIEVRTARGRTFEEMDGTPGDPDSALWARVPGHLTPSAATLAIVGDYVSGAGVATDRPHAPWAAVSTTPSGWSRFKPTEWVLCDIRIHALVGGYAQGIAFLWSEDGRPSRDGEPVDRRAPVAGGRRSSRVNKGAMTDRTSRPARLVRVRRADHDRRTKAARRPLGSSSPSARCRRRVRALAAVAPPPATLPSASPRPTSRA